MDLLTIAKKIADRVEDESLKQNVPVAVTVIDIHGNVVLTHDLYPLLAVSGGRYSAMGGGVPLTSEDEVIAGVGVSGGTTEQDIAIVEAAMT